MPDASTEPPSTPAAELVDELPAEPETGTISDQLVPLAGALKEMGRPNSGITWIRQPYVKETLRALAAADEITHELLDQIPGRQQSKAYIRGQLVEYGALPPSDELPSRFEVWSTEAIERAADPTHRDAIRRYITWHHQRRLRDSPNPTTHGTFLRAKLEQEEMVTEVSCGTKLATRDRAAAILVVVFAQQIEDVVPPTWDQIDVGPIKVAITLGKTRIELPPPLDEPFRELAAAAPSNTAAQPNSNWALGTLHELTKLAPIAIVADALGYPQTIERRARALSAVTSVSFSDNVGRAGQGVVGRGHDPRRVPVPYVTRSSRHPPRPRATRRTDDPTPRRTSRYALIDFCGD